MDEEYAAVGGSDGIATVWAGDVAAEIRRVFAEFVDLERPAAIGIYTTLETHGSCWQYVVSHRAGVAARILLALLKDRQLSPA